MTYHFLMVLVVAILASGTNPTADAQITGTQKMAIEKGLNAGKALAEVLKNGDFRDSLVKLGKNLAPFLSALGPLAGFALAFIPTGDSEELAYMRKQFKEINNKLDIITSEFKEVKNAIDWNAVVVSYGAYERKIRAAEANLNRVYEVQGEARKNERNNFINQYESDFENSLQKLYHAIMENDRVFSKNILEAAVKYMKNHKRKIEQFSLGLIKLLVQGIKVKVSYYGMKNWTADHVRQEWTGKMDNLRTRLERLSNKVKSVYKSQLKTDAEDLILRHHGLGTKGLMQKIYDFVVEKYDWRYWFVAVYYDEDLHGFDDHTISLCGGYSLLHRQEMNIVIASQDNSKRSRFNHGDASNLLRNIERDIDNCDSDMENANDRAWAIVNKMEQAENSCVPYALHMAVSAKIDLCLWYISWDSHRAYRKIKTETCCWGRNHECTEQSWNHKVIVFG